VNFGEHFADTLAGVQSIETSHEAAAGDVGVLCELELFVLKAGEEGEGGFEVVD
jgi:hypothetical protein